VALFTQSNVIFCELHDIAGEADSLTGLARTYRRQGRLAEAATCFERALELCRQLADADREAKATLFFAKVRRQQGQPEDALALLSRCRDMFRQVDSGGFFVSPAPLIGIPNSEVGGRQGGSRPPPTARALSRGGGDPPRG